MMKRIYLFILFVFSCVIANAQPNWLWAKSAAGNFQSFPPSHNGSNCVCTDGSGNVFVTGWFSSQTITFGSITLTNTRNENMFLVKYDPSGNVLWAKSSNGIGDNDEGMSVSTDGSGNVYVTGWFSATYCTFGSITLTNAGMFLVKYDSNGNVLWAKNAGGNCNNSSYGVSADGSGNVFVAGYFDNSGPYIIFGSDTLTNAGMFLVKYDATGNVLWAKSGGGGNDIGQSVSTDGKGNVFVTGNFNGNYISFGSDTLINPGDVNIFLVKYDSFGNLLWAKMAGWGIGGGQGPANEVQSCSTDSSGNVLITGGGGTIIFGSDTLNNQGMFLAKYDPSGNVLWVKRAAGTYQAGGSGVSTDHSSNVYVTGWFEDTITFGSFILTNSGMFLVKYDTAGNVLWTKNANGSFPDQEYSVSTDRSSNVFVQGYFNSSINFDNDTLTGGGMFLAKLANSITGINETESDNLFLIYPNPTNGFFQIKSDKLRMMNVEIYNVYGEKIYSSIINNHLSLINLNVPNGVYFVEVKSENGTVTKKIIITD